VDSPALFGTPCSQQIEMNLSIFYSRIKSLHNLLVSDVVDIWAKVIVALDTNN